MSSDWLDDLLKGVNFDHPPDPLDEIIANLDLDEILAPPYDEGRIVLLDFAGVAEFLDIEIDRWQALIIGTNIWASGPSEIYAWVALVAYWKLILMDSYPSPPTPPIANPAPAPTPPDVRKNRKEKRREKKRRKK